MEYAIMGLTFGLCLFILPFWAYRRGIKDGLALNQGKPIEPIQNPVKTIIQHVETRAEKKETKEASSAMIEGFNNLMSYNGDDQTKVGEK